MPKVEINLIVELDDAEDTSATVDAIEEAVVEKGHSVVSVSHNDSVRKFTVTGVDTETKEKFVEEVPATSAADAESQVASQTRIVVDVDHLPQSFPREENS